jgi:starvation-inducible outer membrane lipoprotein
MGAAIRAIAMAILLAACTPPPAAFDREQEEFAVRALITKNPKDQVDADHARMRIVRKIEIAPTSDAARVEGEYLVAPKQGQPGVQTWQGRFVLEAKKVAGTWEIVSDDIQLPAASAQPN